MRRDLRCWGFRWIAKRGRWNRQYFEAGGRNRIAAEFGIDAIPATLLIDKKGMLRKTELRGEALGKAVEKLLEE
jgi:hypothetical protein